MQLLKPLWEKYNFQSSKILFQHTSPLQLHLFERNFQFFIPLLTPKSMHYQWLKLKGSACACKYSTSKYNPSKPPTSNLISSPNTGSLFTKYRPYVFCSNFVDNLPLAMLIFSILFFSSEKHCEITQINSQLSDTGRLCRKAF